MNDNNINEAGVSPKQIFEIMKANIFDNFYTYSYSSINKDYLYSRKTLFNILHKITKKLGFKSQTFFLCTLYLDMIFSIKKKINVNLNLLGLSALCLAAKYVENDPIVPHLQYFLKVYNYILGYKSIISISDLKSAEVMALKLLDYKLNYYTIYDFNSFLFGHGILKLEQIKEIEDNKPRRHYRNKRNDFFNHTSSLMIKNILEKIYQRSRYYLDIIVNETKLNFKYNSLILSIYIMRKSVFEILAHEQNIAMLEKNEREQFYKKNLSCFRQIMHNFYNIDYETNEQFRELLVDEEIQEIFENKEKTKIDFGKISLCGYKTKEKKEDEKENNILDFNKLNNNDIDNRSIFASSVTNGFFKRLRLKPNFDEVNKSHHERNMISSRKERNTINYNNDNTYDNININMNINEEQISYKTRELKKRILAHTNKSASNISIQNKSRDKDKNKEREESTNRINKKLSNVSFTNNNEKNNGCNSNKLIQRIENYNKLKNKIMTNNEKNTDIDYSINTFHGSNFCLNKKPELKTEENSPMHTENKSNTKNTINYLNYSRMNKFIKIKGLNNGKERSDYSCSYVNNNDETNKNDVSTDNINNAKNSKKSYEKRPYFKKFIHQNTTIDNYISVASMTRNGIGSNYNSTNITSDVDKNQYNSINAETLRTNNNESVNKNLKINPFYNNRRSIGKNYRLNGKNNCVLNSIINSNMNSNINTLNTSINMGNENNNGTKEPIKINRYKKRFYNILNSKASDISGDIQTDNTLIIKDNNNNNKMVIEPYNQAIANNKRIYSRFLTNNSVFGKKNNNNLQIDTRDTSYDDNKGITSHHFYRHNRSKVNINTTRNSEIQNSENNKSFIEPKRRITFLLGKQNSKLNNTLKEINQAIARSKNKEIKNENRNDNDSNEEKEKERNLNILNNNDKDKEISNNIKVNFTKSIRQKYLTLNNKNSSSSVNINNNNITQNCNNNYNTNINANTNTNINSNSISIRNRYSRKNIHKSNQPITIETNTNSKISKIPISRKLSDAEKKDNSTDNKTLNKSSIYKMINQTRTLFKRNPKEEEQNQERENEAINDISENNNENNKKGLYNNTNINFYKSQKCFYKNRNEKYAEDKRNKEEISKNQQDKKLGSSYIRNIMDNNKLTKDKKENKFQSHQNSYNRIPNDNSHVNIENKNSNGNELSKIPKYKKIYRRNNVNGNGLKKNESYNDKNENGAINGDNNDYRTSNSIINNGEGKFQGNTFYKFPFYRKNGNYNTAIFNRK